MEDTLRKLQLTQLDILKVIDGFCRKHGLNYSLYAGSLLGAARHQGFIPWDDDLDICLKRSDYNRFIELWAKERPEGYLLQNKETDPAFSQSFTKIRKDHTTFLQDESERGKYHTGIFVDIFPIDRIPEGKLKKYIFYLDCLFYQLYTREFVPPLAGKATQMICGFLLKTSTATSRIRRRKRHFNRLTRFNKDTVLPMIAIETTRSLKQDMPSDLMDSFIDMQFEGMKCMCVKEWKTYLTNKFGNYMQLPPEEERGWGHHPVVLDFERNLEEL